MGLPFDKLCVASGLPKPIAEYRFHPLRRWRFDWAFVDQKIAIEVEGGIFIQGRHSRGVGMKKDMEKYNTAALMGWRVFRVTPKEMPARALSLASDALKAEMSR